MIKNTQEGSVIVIGIDQENTNEIEKKLSENPEKDFKVEKETIKNPDLKLFKTKWKCVKKIIGKDFPNCETNCEVLHSFTNNITKKLSIIIEVSSKL